MAGPDVHEELLNDGTVFRIWFIAPASLKDHPEYEQMVWDECLRRADAAGHIAVGSILISDEPVGTSSPALVEGESLRERMQRFHDSGAMMANILTGFTGGTTPSLIKVTAEVTLGASLGGLDFDA